MAREFTADVRRFCSILDSRPDSDGLGVLGGARRPHPARTGSVESQMGTVLYERWRALMAWPYLFLRKLNAAVPVFQTS